MRFRLALTESEPTIKGYEAAAWGELSDARTAPVEPSLALLDALHQRWVLLLRSLAPGDFARTFRRPDSQVVTLDRAEADRTLDPDQQRNPATGQVLVSRDTFVLLGEA